MAGDTASNIAEAATIAETVAKAIPGVGTVVTALDPLIALVMTAIMAHHNATGKWPSAEQVQADLPADYQKLVADGAWTPSGDGTLAPKTS